MSASFRTISFSFEAVRRQEVCWRSSEEGQQNCELKVGDGVGALSSLHTVLPDCRTLETTSLRVL